MRSGVLFLTAALCAIGPIASAAPDAAGVAGGKRPDISLPLEGAVITQPDWVQKPNGDDFATYYPAVAQMVGLDGRVLMSCEVTTVGNLDPCTIRQETPIGMGFGEAALKMSQLFRMKPMSLDGHPVSGGKINIPIQFEMPASQADAGTAAEAGPPPAPKALELARQIAASTYGPDQMQAVRARVKESMDQRFRSESLTEQEQAALDDYLAALDASGPARAQAYAEVIARHFTEQQLVEIAAFVGSPTGQAWTRGGADLSAASAQAAARLDEDMMSDTKKRFCGKYECLQPAAAAPASRAKP